MSKSHSYSQAATKPPADVSAISPIPGPPIPLLPLATRLHMAPHDISSIARGRRGGCLTKHKRKEEKERAEGVVDEFRARLAAWEDPAEDLHW